MISIKISFNKGKLFGDDATQSVIYQRPYGGDLEEEMQEYFEDIILPVVEALIEAKCSKIEEEFRDDDHQG